jgi:hypothetical protein
MAMWDFLNPINPFAWKPQVPAKPGQLLLPFQQNDPFQNKIITVTGLQQSASPQIQLSGQLTATPQNPNGFIGGAITFNDQAALTPTRTQKAILTDIPISDKVPLFVPTQKMREDFVGDTSVTGLSERYGGSSPVTAIKPLKPQEDRGVYGNINRAVGEVTGLKNFPTYEKAIGGTADQIAGVKHSTVQNGLSYEDKMRVMAGDAKGAEVDLYGADGNYVKTQRVTAPDNALRGAYQFTKKLWDLPKDDPVGAIAYYGTPVIAPVAGAVIGGSTKVPVIARAAIPAINLVSKPLPALTLNAVGKATVGAVAADQGAKVAGYDADWGQLARGKSPFIRNPELDKTPVGARLATAVTTLVPVLAGENWLNKKTAPAATAKSVTQFPTPQEGFDKAILALSDKTNKIFPKEKIFYIADNTGEIVARVSGKKSSVSPLKANEIQKLIDTYGPITQVHNHPAIKGVSVNSMWPHEIPSWQDIVSASYHANELRTPELFSVGQVSNAQFVKYTPEDLEIAKQILDYRKFEHDATTRGQTYFDAYLDAMRPLDIDLGMKTKLKNLDKIDNLKDKYDLVRYDTIKDRLVSQLEGGDTKLKNIEYLKFAGDLKLNKEIKPIPDMRKLYPLQRKYTSIDTEYDAIRDFKNTLNKYSSGLIFGRYKSTETSINKLVGMQAIYSQPKPRKATKGQKSVVAEMFGTRAVTVPKPNIKPKFKSTKVKKSTKPVSVVEEMFGSRCNPNSKGIINKKKKPVSTKPVSVVEEMFGKRRS